MQQQPQGGQGAAAVLQTLDIAGPGCPDFGTARARLPASYWTATGVLYHRPVCARLPSAARPGSEWRIYCTSALCGTQQDCLEQRPVLDARVVLPPAGLALSQLQAEWEAAKRQGAEGGGSAGRLALQPITSPVLNASSVQFAVPPGLEHLARLRPKLHQALVVLGAYVQLAPGIAVQVVGVEAGPGGGSAAAGGGSSPAPSRAGSVRSEGSPHHLFRITPTTAISVVGEAEAAQFKKQEEHSRCAGSSAQAEDAGGGSAAGATTAGAGAGEAGSASKPGNKKKKSSSSASKAAEVKAGTGAGEELPGQVQAGEPEQEAGSSSTTTKSSSKAKSSSSSSSSSKPKTKAKKKKKEEEEEEGSAGGLSGAFGLLGLLGEDE